MSDITKCSNEQCIMKDRCKRFTAKDSYWQSYSLFFPVSNLLCNFKCEYYEPVFNRF